MRLAIRVFIRGVQQFEERIDVDPDNLDHVLPELAKQHAGMMAVQPGMVEIEFLDEPDVDARYFRLGTDPSGMVYPIAVDANEPKVPLQ
jgi:hypothetical protein